MATGIVHAVVSADGFIADENDDVGPPFEWYFSDAPDVVAVPGQTPRGGRWARCNLAVVANIAPSQKFFANDCETRQLKAAILTFALPSPRSPGGAVNRLTFSFLPLAGCRE
jgi:hypothetical protein